MPNSHAGSDGPLFFSPPATKPPRKPRERREGAWCFDPQEVFALKDPRLRSLPFLTLREVSKLAGKNDGAIWSDCVTRGRYPYWRRGKRFVLFLQPWANAIIDDIRRRKGRPLMFGITEMPPWTKKPRWLVAEPVPEPEPEPEAQAEPVAEMLPPPPPSRSIPLPPGPSRCRSPEEIADWYAVPRVEVLRAIERDELRAFVMVGQWRVADADLAAWLEGQRPRRHTLG